MKTPKQVKVLEQICSQAKAEGKLTEDHVNQLSEELGSRFTKAFEAVKE